MSNTICYKMKTPVVYNKGTKYERTCDTFLAYYTSQSDAEAQAEAEWLNTTKLATLRTGTPINWEKIDYFFVNKQEEMY